MTRWKAEPLKWRGFPDLPMPFSPVQRARKFSAVLGTTSARSSMTMRPAAAPPIEISKKTLGLAICLRVEVSVRLGSADQESSSTFEAQKGASDKNRSQEVEATS